MHVQIILYILYSTSDHFFHIISIHVDCLAFTLEENNRVANAFSPGALHSSIDVAGDSREGLRDVLGESLLQCVVVVAEHLVILEQHRQGEALQQTLAVSRNIVGRLFKNCCDCYQRCKKKMSKTFLHE